MNVLYASDDKFAGILGTSLVSLMENNRDSSEINVFILDDGISQGNKEKLNMVSRVRNPLFLTGGLRSRSSGCLFPSCLTSR